MRKALASALLALMIGGIIGCDSPPSPIAPDEPARAPSVERAVPGYEAVAPRPELIATPNGWYHRSCVHEIPNGAIERRGGSISTRDGASVRLPDCRYPGKRDAEGRPLTGSIARASNHQSPENNGWIEHAEYELSGHTYSELSAEWGRSTANSATRPGSG